MDLFILLSILFILILWVLIIKFNRIGGVNAIKARSAHKHMAIAKQSSRYNVGLFDVNEKAFYAVLCHACMGRGLVFGKLSAIDIFKAQAALTEENGLRKYRKIDYKVFDFVVCDPVNLSIIALINCHEDDAGGKRKKPSLGSLSTSEKEAWSEVGVRVLACHHDEKNMLALRRKVFK